MPHIHNCELDAEKNWKRGQELIHWSKMMTNPACTKHHLTAVEILGLEAHLPHCIHASDPERKQVDKYHNGSAHKNSLRGLNKTEDLFLPTLFPVHIQSMLVMAVTHYTLLHTNTYYGYITSSMKETLLLIWIEVFDDSIFGGAVKDQANPQRDVCPCTNSVVRTAATPKVHSFAVSTFRLSLRPIIVVYQLAP